MLDNVGLRYPHRASGAKAPRTLRPLPLLRFAVSATGGAHLCSIQYYLRFWLSSCRTSLAVSALRIMRYCLKFIPKRGGEPLAKAANKRRKTKTNHLYDTAALGGGLPCPAGGGLVLLGTQPAGRRHGVRTTACQPAGAGGRRDEHQLVLFHRAAGAQHPAGHGTVVPAVHQLGIPCAWWAAWC